MNRHLCRSLVVVAVALALWGSFPGWVVAQHVEDFTSDLYKDAPNTTAWWDTLAGELKLFPFSLATVGAYDTPGLSYGVFVAGDHAFVADEVTGLVVIDITDPAAPAYAGGYNTPDRAWGLYVAGDHAFVADGESGVLVIDITAPATPTLLGSYNTPGYAYGVYVSGNYAFVADWDGGLAVVNITNPGTPTLAGSYDTPGRARGVYVAGDRAFVADYNEGLVVLDITNPASPSMVGSYDTPGTSRGVVVSGDGAYVADGGGGLQLIDVSNPAVPTLAGSYDTPGTAVSVYVAGDRAYLADYDSGIHVIDISSPAFPMLIGLYDTPGYAYDVHASGEHAFVADVTDGLQVLHVADLLPKPTLIGSYIELAISYGVQPDGDVAYVAMGESGLNVIDISDPANPVLVGNYNTPGEAMGVDVSGDLVFVVDFYTGLLQLIDITNPAAPTLTGSHVVPANAWEVRVSGDRAYVVSDAAITGTLTVVDVSNPAAPSLAGSYTTAWGPRDCHVVGDYAFLPEGIAGLEIVDISNPAAPTQAGIYNTPGEATGVHVAGDLAFVADLTSLQVIDITNPAVPVSVGSYATPGQANRVRVSGNYAFVTADSLLVIDVSDPTAPVLAASTSDPAGTVKIAGDHAFVPRLGLQIFQVFRSDVDPDGNLARSLAFDASADTIYRARLATTQTGTVDWELSADGGTTWQGSVPGGGWERFTVPGDDLLWRSTLDWEPSNNPKVTEVRVDWLVSAASIDSIVDVPDDQGGWVRTRFTRSAHDFSDETTLAVTNYGIWRRVDDASIIAAVRSGLSLIASNPRASIIDILDGPPVVRFAGRTFVQPGPNYGAAAASFPPGTWEWVATVPAVQHDDYYALIPSVADSSDSGIDHTVLVVTTHTVTPSTWFISGADSGYSVDNIAPSAPSGVTAAYNTGSGNQLSWDVCPDEDFDYFRIYRSTDPDFVPSPAELVHSTVGTNWADPEYDGWNIYYKITATDYAGNESDPSSPENVTAAGESGIPRTFTLYQNVPNPFNPTTVIRYDVPPSGGPVTIRIYDVAGRLVRTLVDAEQSAGARQVVWHGLNDRGARVATGMYFYRMTAPGYERTRKMMLVQ
jgi:hypothetical protein